MSNIKQFKNKKERFDEWLSEVMSGNNLKENPPESCVILYTNSDSKSYMVHYQCDADDIYDFATDLNRVALERKFDDYLRNHISDYLEYV